MIRLLKRLYHLWCYGPPLSPEKLVKRDAELPWLERCRQQWVSSVIRHTIAEIDCSVKSHLSARSALFSRELQDSNSSGQH